jgi:shikimate kinase
VVYISLPYEVLCERIGDLTARGVSIHDGQSFRQLYEERLPLYQQYGEITVEAEGLSIREVVHALKEKLQ